MSQTTTVAARSAHVFDRAPVMLYWEITRACDLACKHCRADALPCRDPGELDFLEAIGLLSQITDFGSPLPHLVITGGDPLKRRDLEDIVKEAVRLGIPTSLAPSATPLLTSAALVKLQRAGLSGLSLSLDGSTAKRARSAARRRGVLRAHPDGGTRGDEPGIVLADQHAGERADPARPPRDLRAPADTADPAMEPVLPDRRWARPRAAEYPTRAGGAGLPLALHHIARSAVHRSRNRGAVLQTRGARTSATRPAPSLDPSGSATATVSPSCLIGARFSRRVSCRWSRATSATRRWSTSIATAPLFSALRDTDQLRGKCARCPFKAICGGSRARAYAHSGDYLGADPLCEYQPSTGPLVA